MDGRKIRVLIIDDSMFFRVVISRLLNAMGDIEVVGEAYDPYEARPMIETLAPDVMTLDVEMPYMNGIEFMRALIPQCKIPVLIVSSLYTAEAEAMKAGAAAFLAKPTSRNQDSVAGFGAELARFIRAVANGQKPLTRAAAPQPEQPKASAPQEQRVTAHSAFSGIIAIGASTGGTQATARILRDLPADMMGIVVTQHMPPDFTRMYAENLDRDCAVTVREAKDGDIIERGLVLIAPGGDRHMEVARRGACYCVRLVSGEKVNGHCPSVDVLFNSVARVVPGRECAGVLLTGMGADGARGLLAMRGKGAYTIGQDEKSSVVYGMPKEAFAMGAVTRQAPLDGIAALLVSFARDGRRQ